MSKSAISAKRQNSFLADPKYLCIVDFDTPEGEDTTANPRVDKLSNSKTIEANQKEGFVASFGMTKEPFGNNTEMKVAKVPCDPSDPCAYVHTDPKTGEQTREDYRLEVCQGRFRTRGCRAYNDMVGAGSPQSIDYKMVRVRLASRHETPEQTIMETLAENYYRREFSAMDLAHQILEYKNAGQPVEGIAAKFGIKASEVYASLSLTKLSEPLQKAVDEKILPKTAAAELGRKVESHEEQERIVEASKGPDGKVKGATVQENIRALESGTPSVSEPKTKKPNRARILEVKSKIAEEYPEAAAALQWVLTGDSDMFAMILENVLEPSQEQEEPLRDVQGNEELPNDLDTTGAVVSF